jgi:stearoyl-CoA desaturase (delta-9 desaturase)
MKINKQAFIGLIIYPAILLTLGIIYSSSYSIGWLEISLFWLGYYVSNITVGIALHRLWSHNSYKTTKFVEFILAILSAGVLQGPAIAWASDHYKHHTYTDKDLDPHTPLKYKNRIQGFLWSHIGWMLYKDFDNKPIDTITMKKLGGNKILIWQLKNYWKLVFFMQAIPPFILGYLITGTVLGGYAGFLFIGLGRCFQQHITFCVNSICHFWGTQKYTNGSARDVWWLGLLLLGENWHNFHHAFPTDYRNGVKWYQFDVHKWIIYLMSKVGLAWDLQATADVRINAKVQETAKQALNGVQSEWQNVNDMYQKLRETVYAKIDELDHSSIKLKNNILQNLDDLKVRVDVIMNEIKICMESPEKSSKQLLEATKNNFKSLKHNFESIVGPMLI